MSKKLYKIIGCILIFVVTVLICGRFSYGTLWINYLGKSANENFWLNALTLFTYTAVFVVGIVLVRKGKDE